MKVHPAIRRRANVAERVLVDRPWRTVLADWSKPGGVRHRFEANNLAIQDVDLAALDDAALVRHVHRTIDHAVVMWDHHFHLHSHDLGPVGLLLDAAVGWGLAASEVIPLLEGASPSTSEAERVLRRIRDQVDRVGGKPNTLDELRQVGPDIAADLDAFLRLRGHLIVSRYDIDGLTLAESPQLVLSTIMSARDDTARVSAAAEVREQRVDALRARLAVDDQPQFDLLLAEARASMDLRDDNGPHTLEWPLGLIRLALLELGRRMVNRGWCAQAELALELAPDEVAPAVVGAGPSGDELSARHRWRRDVDIDDAPRHLGRVEPIPPLDVLPPAMARIARFVQQVIAEIGADGEVRTTGLTGVGVGGTVYRGVARLAHSPEAALQQLSPGDVLVVPCTTPAFNLVLSMAGAVVTSVGGALSHAAVLARELGIPAVVGAPTALSDIPDGAMVEVDPVAGVVRVVARP